MSKTVKDLTAGTAGGIAQVRMMSRSCSLTRTHHRGPLPQVLVGQPFDIVKVVCSPCYVITSHHTK